MLGPGFESPRLHSTTPRPCGAYVFMAVVFPVLLALAVLAHMGPIVAHGGARRTRRGLPDTSFGYVLEDDLSGSEEILEGSNVRWVYQLLICMLYRFACSVASRGASTTYFTTFLLC